MAAELNKREREIMDIIYRRGEVSARDVTEDLGDQMNYSTARTFLTILENKGLLTHRQEGKRYVYLPTVSRAEAGRAVLKRALSTYFQDSLSQAVASLLEDERGKPDEATLGELNALIEKARQEGR